MYPKYLNKLEGELEHVLVKVITILGKNLGILVTLAICHVV